MPIWLPWWALVACWSPSGSGASGVDCEDAAHADAEVCDGVDNDCDGLVDEPEDVGTADCYVDADGDGYGAGAATAFCACPLGYASQPGDCDDGRGDVRPGAVETCDGIDQDCDGEPDSGTDVAGSTWYADDDGDGYGDPADNVVACSPPAGFTANADDCDDTDANSHPFARDACDDGADEDCDGHELSCPLAGREDPDLIARATVSGAPGQAVTRNSSQLAVLQQLRGGPALAVASSNARTVYVFGSGLTGALGTRADATSWADTSSDIALGSSIGAVDVWGVGVSDLYVGADLVEPGGAGTSSGSAVFRLGGPLAPGENPVETNATGAYVLTGDEHHLAVGPSPGDLDGDGVAELALIDTVCSGADCTGSALLVPADVVGRADPTDVAIARIDNGVSYSYMTVASGSGRQDLDGDGVPDIALTTSVNGAGVGQASVFYGPMASGTVQPSDADVLLTGVNSDDQTGPLSIGDFDGDGLDDLVVGTDAVIVHDELDDIRGRVYVVPGPVSGGGALEDEAAWTFDGEGRVTAFAEWTLATPDLNDDGSIDLVVGAAYDDVGGKDSGATYLWYGGLPQGAWSASSADAVVAPSKDFVSFGDGAIAADADGDGIDDLLVSGHGWDGGRGRVWLFAGTP